MTADMTTGAEVDPGRRPGMGRPVGLEANIGARGSVRNGVTTPLNPSSYSGSTAMNPPNIYGGKGQGAQTVASGDLVYWGNDKNNKPQFQDKSMARNAWMSFPDPVLNQLTGLMDQAFGKDRWRNSQLQHYWSQAVDGANYALYANNQYVNPIDVFPRVVGMAAQDRARQGGGGGGGPSMTTQVRLSDPQTARGLLDQALAQALGRDASPVEQRRFLRALNRAEAQAPTVTRSMRTGAGASVVTTGGFNPSTFAQEYAEGMQGSAEFQAATTFLDAFMNALKPVV